jgi:hypothetical protein
VRTDISSDRFDQCEIEEMVSHWLAGVRGHNPELGLTGDHHPLAAWGIANPFSRYRLAAAPSPHNSD